MAGHSSSNGREYKSLCARFFGRTSSTLTFIQQFHNNHFHNLPQSLLTLTFSTAKMKCFIPIVLAASVAAYPMPDFFRTAIQARAAQGPGGFGGFGGGRNGRQGGI